MIKLFDIFKFTPQEKALLKRVFTLSILACIGIIAFVWFQHNGGFKKHLTEQSKHKSANDELVTMFADNQKLLPIDIEAHRIAAEEYKNKIPEKAIMHLLRICSVEKKNFPILLELGTAYLQSGMYEKAEATFSDLLQEDLPSDSLRESVMARYGLSLYFSGKIETSSAYLEKTISLFPKSAEAHCYLGQIEAAQNLASEKAETSLRKALELNPDYGEAWYQLARFYMNQPTPADTNYFKARLCLQKQIELEPFNPRAHSRLGMVYFYLKQMYLAEKSYKTALTLNDDDYNTHYNLGELYYTSFNDSIRALQEFEKTLQLNPQHIQANFKKGLICLENNNLNEAIRSFKAALAQDPSNIRMLLQLAVGYEKKSMKQEAWDVYQTILVYDALNDIALQKIRLLGSR